MEQPLQEAIDIFVSGAFTELQLRDPGDWPLMLHALIQKVQDQMLENEKVATEIYRNKQREYEIFQKLILRIGEEGSDPQTTF
jgi:hypothetical protein